jgi:hypothetical protein
VCRKGMAQGVACCRKQGFCCMQSQLLRPHFRRRNPLRPTIAMLHGRMPSSGVPYHRPSACHGVGNLLYSA